uniref:t-SNARE coiled-coil homology domain-containing protein n=1 Tax=Arcella intermedia TaxID=1963864 RepID=A0A6B2L835_9EUKA
MTVQVNTGAARQALSLLQETEQMGAAALMELEKQAEQIDRIENSVENIHSNMDKAERLLRGIESLPAYIGNSMRAKKEVVKKPNTPVDRKLVVQKGPVAPMEIEILCKKLDCSFELAILSIEENGLRCLDPNTNKLLAPNYAIKYSEIQAVVLRIRPEHMDIRLQPPKTHKDRFRLMSSYNQIIVNELYFRTDGNISIQFEIGSNPFEYGLAKISTVPPSARKAVQNGFFLRGENQGFKTSSLMGEDVSQEVKDQLDEVDDNLDKMSNILVNVREMNMTMGQELDRQNDQLNRVSKRVDDADERIKNSNIRINKML